MMNIRCRSRRLTAACAVAGWLIAASLAHATGVPIGGFLPLVGIGLTNEFDDDLNTFPTAMNGVGGTLLGAGGSPYYDVALLDTGAAVTLLTSQAFNDFGMNAASPGEPDGYRGTEVIEIGGATGTLFAEINDPHGLYASGLQHRTAAAPLAMNNSLLKGQTNTSTITLPPESDLPNVVGLSYASQYATYIRSDQPQIFTLEGKTVRTPSIEFLPLGSGGQGITRRAPLTLNPSASFQQPPSWFYNIANPDLLNNPHENPMIPTIIQGGLFLNVNLANGGAALNNSSFFFDTGADVSVLSELTALQLGIDVQLDEPDFTVAVIGSGGEKGDVPGYFLDTFTIQAIGGSVTATNVPVIVLDVADPSNPANIVPGIVGTNLLAGRNVVIDPIPSLGTGGSPSLYISDPVTSQHEASATFASNSWEVGNAWKSGAPGTLGIANLRNTRNSGVQQMALNADATIWELNVSGPAADRFMKLNVKADAQLTTFAGINIEEHGAIQLEGGSLDAQFVEILGGTLTGSGSIFTGSGPIAGQVENRGGHVAPGVFGLGGTLNIVGRFASSADALLTISVGGVTADSQYARLVVDGAATLDGTLAVELRDYNGQGLFTPALGDAFTILTATSIGGEFATLDLPGLASPKSWHVDYTDTEVILKVTFPGDFNGDFSVDADDLDVWKDGYGQRYTGADLLAWQRYFGSSVGAVASVPEPAAGALLLAGLAGVALTRRKAKPRGRG